MSEYDSPTVFVPPKPPASKVRSWSPQDWIFDDCIVKVCNQGYISVTAYGGYLTAYRCPKCDRLGAPSIPVYQGALEVFTPEEMAKRRQERHDIVHDAEQRKRMKESLVEGMKALGE